MSERVPLRVLILEDSEFDARVLVSMLRQGGYQVAMERVETGAEFRTALTERAWDVVLADYNLPSFSAPEGLKILQEIGLDLPFIVVSGGIGEDTAVALMKAGAHDYVMKGNLARLIPAVERELREAATRRARREAEAALRESEFRYRLLWQTAADAIVLMDAQSRIQYVNPATKQLFGYDPEELVGQKLHLLQPEELQGAHDAGLRRYLETGIKSIDWKAKETVGRRKDWSAFPIEVSFSDMDLQGQRHFVGFIRDITERKRTEQELRDNAEQFRVAREIQQRLFPKHAPALAGFDLAGSTYPAEATGGDYFDFLPMADGCMGLVVADVASHGLGPALLMAETRAYLRLLSRYRSDVGDILTRANRSLAEDVDYEHYVTLLLVKIDASARTLVYGSAGHPNGYVLDREGVVKAVLRRTGVALGLDDTAAFAASEPVSLASGDLVVLCTDGIEETLSPNNELFGSGRLLDCVRANAKASARDMIAALHRAVRVFAQGDKQMDDITAVVAKCE